MKKLRYTFKTDTLFKMLFVKYPELLMDTEYKYVWFSNPDEKKKEYDYLRHYFKFESAEDGDIYEIQETDGEYRFKYLGNVPIWKE